MRASTACGDSRSWHRRCWWDVLERRPRRSGGGPREGGKFRSGPLGTLAGCGGLGSGCDEGGDNDLEWREKYRAASDDDIGGGMLSGILAT